MKTYTIRQIRRLLRKGVRIYLITGDHVRLREDVQ